MKLSVASYSWADFASDALDDQSDGRVPDEPLTQRDVSAKTSPTEGLVDYVSEVRVRVAARVETIARKRRAR